MSDFKLLYPHIPFFDGFDSTSDNELRLIAGGARNYYQSSTGETGHTFEFGAGTSPLLDGNGEPDYLCLLGINDLMDHDSSSSFGWTVEADPDGLNSGSFTESDLTNGNILYRPLSMTASATVTGYSVTLGWTDTLELRLSKLFLGKAFDFGRNPDRSSSFQVDTSGIRPAYVGTLNFVAIQKEEAENFERYIVPNTDYMTFFFRDEDNCVFDKDMLYTSIQQPLVTWRNDHEADITFQFRELV